MWVEPNYLEAGQCGVHRHSGGWNPASTSATRNQFETPFSLRFHKKFVSGEIRKKNWWTHFSQFNIFLWVASDRAFSELIVTFFPPHKVFTTSHAFRNCLSTELFYNKVGVFRMIKVSPAVTPLVRTDGYGGPGDCDWLLGRCSGRLQPYRFLWLYGLFRLKFRPLFV